MNFSGRVIGAGIVCLALTLLPGVSSYAQSADEIEPPPESIGGALRTAPSNSGATKLVDPALATDPLQNQIRRQDIPVSRLLDGRAEEEIKPFGSQLFASGNLIDRSLGVNPSYEVAPGDRIEVRIWGSWAFDNVLTVDIQGNIFLPEVGPVKVEGARNAELTAIVSARVRKIFQDSVNVYTNLLGTQPIGVFVSGNVERPGRYPGERIDNVLYFIARAGGVDIKSGSFRDIQIIRNGETIARVDLYEFLLKGLLPDIAFKNNDSILVGPQLPLVTVDGEVKNRYGIEMDPGRALGRHIIAVSRPNAGVSHVLVTGVRSGKVFNTYVPIDEYAQMAVFGGDKLVFQSDREIGSIVISVEGNSGGPSLFSVPRSVKLSDMARLIQIDPETADTLSIYLRRKSVAERQRQAIDRALYELQRSVLTGETQSSTASQIRVQEAELVDRFVKNVLAVKPEGRVVLAGNDWSTVLMEDSDVIVVPRRSDVVLVSGEVKVPQTILWRSDRAISDYVDEAGGLSNRGDDGNVLVIRSDGSINSGDAPIRKGDHIMILPKSDEKYFAVIKDIVEVISRIALSSAVVLSLD